MKYDNHCKLCNRTYTSSRSLSYHLRMFHNISRRDYVIETEYNGITPICDNEGCCKEKYFKWSEFGKYCSAKCRANSGEHKRLSANKLRKIQNENSEFKKQHEGMTQYEYILWTEARLEELGFKRQKIINIGETFIREQGNWFVVDFLHEDKKIVIEVDGPDHLQKVDKDNQRDNILKDKGFFVLRVTNEEVSNNIIEVIENIGKCLKI